MLQWLNGHGADRWGLGAFNLYVPQAVWLGPVSLLALLAFKFNRRWLWVLAFYCFWIVGPIMGFTWASRGPVEPAAGGGSLRLMTCNIKYGRRDLPALLEDVARFKPDVVLLQDVEHAMSGPLGAFFRDWNVCSQGQFVIASRWPLIKVGMRPAPAQEDLDGYLLRVILQFGGRPIALYNVHLLSPREGLNAMRVARKRPAIFTEAIQELQDNVERRVIEARAVAALVRQEPGPVILAGDLNAPDQSLEGQTLREANLHDAFAEGGRGYGYTYGHFLLRSRMPWLPGVSWMRIDHILLSPGLESRRCWTGTDAASDHRPVFADLAVKAP
jgi:endonuclease/exonuclease/phosphatase family metal-dependent hydrolase